MNSVTASIIQSKLALYDSAAFLREYTYSGHDLGSVCTPSGTCFRVWSPGADRVALCLVSDTRTGQLPMTKSGHGTWSYQTEASLHGSRYYYLVTMDGHTVKATDPYARCCTSNGTYSVVIDLSQTNPDGWSEDKGPVLDRPTDAVIYELHLRDLSMDSSSGILHKGKFLGLAETGTRNAAGLPTGLDHIRGLGVTHIHLLPCFDYASVDETKPSFNWGYDPANYNIPEGSYVTAPNDPVTRIREMKEMIHTLHAHGLGVIMDVVYNHTAIAEDSHFNLLAPYYYYRMMPDGSFANGSDCGNETASERPMMRNFLIDSVAYWATEYHIDGFRFDLMGLHDIDTMNAIRARLDEINPQLLMYGEGWTGGPSPLPESRRAIKQNMTRLPRIAAFSDNLRDAIKGSVFDAKDTGFVSGRRGLCEDIRFGICGCAPHPEINLKLVRSADAFWAAEPSQCINYVSAHDNYTLWDKLACSCPKDSPELRIRRNKLAAAIYLTSQGIPFFQAGEEFLRTKPSESGTGFDDNSYRSPDSVNSLKWDRLTEYSRVCGYYRGLIAFRKAHPALRLDTSAAVARHLTFLKKVPAGTVGYLLLGHAGGDSINEIAILLNPTPAAVSFSLPKGDWSVYISDAAAGTTPLAHVSGSTVRVPAVSCFALGRD